jgi:DNA polymerase-3 subunit delta'
MKVVQKNSIAPWIERQLTALLARRGHAWLLQGPSGLGQFDLALALARAWLCEAPTPQGACGVCASCHAIDVHTHADFAALMPESEMLARKWPMDEKTQSELDGKTRKPSKEIKVDAMREMIEFTQLTNSRGHGKAVLIFPAERMNEVTASALLKTLEEPPGDMHFALASEAAHTLLPTIRSRCQMYTMIWPNEKEVLTWLTEQGVPTKVVPALLAAAGGRPQSALDLARSAPDATQAASAWAALPKTLARGGIQAATAVANLGTPEIIDRMQKICHDLMSVQTGAQPRFFTAADLPRLSIGNRQMVKLSRWAKQLVREAQVADHPFSQGLTVDALVSAAQIALN